MVVTLPAQLPAPPAVQPPDWQFAPPGGVGSTRFHSGVWPAVGLNVKLLLATIDSTARVSNTAPPVPGAVTVTLVLLTASPPLWVWVAQVPSEDTWVNATAPAWNTVLPLSVMATVLEMAEGFCRAHIPMLTQLLELAVSEAEQTWVRAVPPLPPHFMLLTVGVEAAEFWTMEMPTSR